MCNVPVMLYYYGIIEDTLDDTLVISHKCGYGIIEDTLDDIY